MRLLFLILLALPLAAQYPAGAVFHRGDDPRWADPGFDDHQWEKQSDYRPDSYDDYLQNRSWMRARVTIPAGEPAVIVSQHCPCEFYVNGFRVGAIGDLNQPRPYTPRETRIFPLPAGIAPGEAVFAVRRYDSPVLENLNSTWARSSAMLVPASRTNQALAQFDKVVRASTLITFLIALVAVSALLGATWGQRKDAAFWVAIVMEACSIPAMLFGVLQAGGIGDHSDLNSIGWSIASPMGVLAASILLLVVPGLNQRFWLPVCLLAWGVRIPFHAASFFGVPPSWAPFAVAGSEAGVWLIVVTNLLLVTLALRLGSIPRPLLLFGFLGPLLSLFIRMAPMLHVPQQLIFFDVAWTWARLAQISFSLMVAALVIWRAQVRRRQELRQQEELAAAKEVQSLLLASPYQANPQLQIETAYVPASAVGGDFYYVRDFADGSQVALVGDVSGKGLKAAMVVSVAIGILRTVKSSSPAAILATMNEGLAGQTGSGFVTACCARFEADGSAVLANAGHPAPYVDGRELEMAPGLPLGVVAGVVYAESASRGEQFTFVSDGVVEAENAQRELFGFDRTREISTRSAQAIADAAKQWGQNDDITVVTVRRTGA